MGRPHSGRALWHSTLQATQRRVRVQQGGVLSIRSRHGQLSAGGFFPGPGSVIYSSTAERSKCDSSGKPRARGKCRSRQGSLPRCYAGKDDSFVRQGSLTLTPSQTDDIGHRPPRSATLAWKAVGE